MINLPQHSSFVSSIMPSQNVPMQQTGQNFPITYQQPQTVTQQMQTTPSVAYPTNPQDSFKPFYQLHQADVFAANHQYHPNLQPLRSTYPSSFQPCTGIPAPVQTQPNYGSLPESILHQIRSCVGSAAPIFILPGGCHQTGASNLNEGVAQHGRGQSTNVNPFASIHCPPSFYPYPVAVPLLEPFGVETRGRDRPRGCLSCCGRKRRGLDGKEYAVGCCCDVHEQEEHRCTATNDDTICSKRDCPASISLQALASQFLSLPGIISCAATRLILRKIPGSNVTGSTEDTMDKAIKCLQALDKEQLLAECRNAQHANALISLHMTTNPPVNVIPLLTLLQLKVNVLKAQVENLIDKKVTECQGFGFQVETSSSPIDPTVLSMKTNAELRQLLSALRQKECDERVNVNFSPYHSQKVIAECRLNNVQAKIRQVEAEFDRRREISVPGPTLTSRVIRQFSESTCAFGFAQARLFEPCVQARMLDSPDPFAQSVRSPRRLALKPLEPAPRTARCKEEDKAVATTCENGTNTRRDAEAGEGAVVGWKEKTVESKSSEDTCSCEESTSDESLDEGKKKLGLRIDRRGNAIVSSVCCSRDVHLLRLVPRIVERIRQVTGQNYAEDEREEAKGEGREWREEDGQEDSATEFNSIEEIGIAGKEFQVITIDDDDEDTKSKTFDDGKASVKKERESHTNVGEKTGVHVEAGTLRKTDVEENSEGVEAPVDAGFPIKREAESIERMIDSDYKDVKGEPAENGQSDRKRSPTTADVERKNEAIVWKSDVQVEAKPKGYVLVTEKEIVRKPDCIESLGVGSSCKETEVGKEDDRASKEEQITENVPVHQETVNRTVANRQPSRKSSSDLYKTLNYAVIAKPASPKKQRKKRVSNEDEVNSEWRKKERKRRNVQIVSTMTRVKYNRHFVDIWGWNNANESEMKRDFSESVDEENEDERCLLSKKEHSPTIRSEERRELVSMVPTSTETNDDIEENTLARKMFPKSRRTNGEKMTNGLRRFPPLKHAYSNAVGTTTTTTTAEISENLLGRKEVESSCSKIVGDRSGSYRCSSKMENGIVSVIYSMVESQFVSLNSLLGNIPSFQGVLSNFHLDKSSNDTHDQHNLNSNRDEVENKRAKSQKNNCILLPSNTNAYDDSENDAASGGNRVSVGEQCINVHETRHSIIVDREKKDYLLIGGSVSGQSRQLSRNGFKRPCHTRRNILIRSRLKNSTNSRHEYLHPFTMLKRSKGKKIVASEIGSRIQDRLKARERFLALPGIPEHAETLSNGKRDNAFVTMNRNAPEQRVIDGSLVGMAV